MLIAMMVGRNEVDRYLERVLDRLLKQVDMLCFLDDCSEDNTLEVVKSYGTHFNIETAEMEEPTFIKDEGKLRQTAWDLVCKHAELGDWILAIDCDEELYGAADGHNLMRQNKWDVIGITFYHMWNDTQYRNDGAWKPTLSSRMFRFKPGGVFRERKLACGAEPSYVQDLLANGRFLKDSPLRMKHLGYARALDQRAKYERYMELDGGEFHSLKHLKSILDVSPVLVDWND